MREKNDVLFTKLVRRIRVVKNENTLTSVDISKVPLVATTTPPPYPMPRDATVCFCPHNGKDRSDEKGQQRGSSFATVIQLDSRVR